MVKSVIEEVDPGGYLYKTGAEDGRQKNQIWYKGLFTCQLLSTQNTSNTAVLLYIQSKLTTFCLAYSHDKAQVKYPALQQFKLLL